MATVKWLCDVCGTYYKTKQEAVKCETELKGIKLPILIKPGDKIYLLQAVNPKIPVTVKSIRFGSHPKGLRGMHSVYVELTELVSLEFYDELHGNYESAESEVCLDDITVLSIIQ